MSLTQAPENSRDCICRVEKYSHCRPESYRDYERIFVVDNIIRQIEFIKWQTLADARCNA